MLNKNKPPTMRHLSYIFLLFILQSCELFETHPFDGKVTGETEIFVNALNKRNDIDFVIHGGYISNFALPAK
jgi:hypothetical protein